ncbi:MAG: hypothetical protein EGQ16_06240 [Clostridiales bacterium]|nr:hypothetical protein [Clostridiales bacterium]MBD9159409.1 hypothetical protein [Clostridiales bacterium]
MNFRSEKGFTGIDIAVSVVIIFIFISIIAMLSYRINSTSKEIQLKSDAIYVAINEIENAKSKGLEEFEGRSVADGNSVVVENVETEKQGYYKTITVLDYTDLDGNADKTKDIVKKVTVKITYMYKAKEQSVELSTLLTKES